MAGEAEFVHGPEEGGGVTGQTVEEGRFFGERPEGFLQEKAPFLASEQVGGIGLQMGHEPAAQAGGGEPFDMEDRQFLPEKKFFPERGVGKGRGEDAGAGGGTGRGAPMAPEGEEISRHIWRGSGGEEEMFSRRHGMVLSCAETSKSSKRKAQAWRFEIGEMEIGCLGEYLLST